MTATIAQMSETPTAVNIDAVNLQISLPQMLNLALGSPEIGAVNFNILHNFLHILLHQINLHATKVEFHGENADRIKRMITCLQPSPIFQLDEYNIIDVVGEIPRRIQRDDGADADVLAEDSQLPTEKILKVTKDLKEEIDVEKDKLTVMVQDVIKGDTSIADTSLINARLDELEDKVSKMELWLINLQTVTDVLSESITAPTTGIDVAALEKEEDIKATIVAAEPTAINDVTLPYPKEEKEKEISEVADDKTDKPIPSNDKLAPREPFMNGAAIAEIRQNVATLKTDVTRIQEELQQLNTRVAKLEVPPTIVDVCRSSVESVERPVIEEPIEERPVVGELIKDEEKIVKVSDVTNLEQCLEAVKNVETIHNEALKDITQRVVVLETEIGHLLKKMDGIQDVDKIGDVTYINELVAKMKEIETDIEKIGKVVDRVFDDKEKQDTHINTLLEQIELLKIVKANKDDLEDALAEKADAQAVNRKVSHDQFDAAYDDLARGLEEAIDKLTKQELIWQQALDEVQNEIAAKMDKNEMTPLKDFVNNKLRSLQEKLKIMIEARREIEAAGTKKLLRDVQCISCDKDVVMKTEEVSRFRTEPLPCTTSVKPYLTYELDKVRKQQRKLPHSRNMIQFEAVMQEETKKMKAKEEMLARTPFRDTRDHFCNRYCGGSHTITTPQQRVLRTGHFLTQWGPETVQLTDGLIRGKDGQMYRSQPMPGKDVCGLDCWESQISEETGPSECCSTASRKPLPFQRNSAGNQKQNSRKQSKEPKISKSEEKLIETHQMTSLQENDDRSLVPAGLQNEITLYRPNKEIKIE